MTDGAGQTGTHQSSALRVAVASPLREATQAAEDAARDGGNAIDAALTAAAVLTVAYPHNCAIGGDLLALVRESDGTTTFVNASGRAMQGVVVDDVRQTRREMPLTGPHTVTVPGLVSGWAALHAKGGARPWPSLLEPAIDAAANGTVVSGGVADAIAGEWSDFAKDPGLRGVLAPDGHPVAAGDTLRQPALARTLRDIADVGPAALYDGDVGEQLVAGLRKLAVPITMADLRAHAVIETEPWRVDVDGWTVSAAPPNSQGFVLLRLLGMLHQADASKSPLLHRRVPAPVLGHAFHRTAAERDALLADPDYVTGDIEALLTPEAFASLLSDSSMPLGIAGHARARRPDGDTVAVVTADSDGRTVSLIQSLYYSFGSQLLEPTTGIVMHNRGACFSLDPASPNMLAPGKRPAHTLSPVLADRGDEHLVVGTMGGEVQPQILLQVLSRLMSGATPQESVAAPRWTVGAWDRGDPTDTVNLEDDVEPDIRAELRAWPGPFNPLPSRSGQVGHAQAVRVNGSDPVSGTDPRADGLPG